MHQFIGRAPLLIMYAHCLNRNHRAFILSLLTQVWDYLQHVVGPEAADFLMAGNSFRGDWKNMLDVCQYIKFFKVRNGGQKAWACRCRHQRKLSRRHGRVGASTNGRHCLFSILFGSAMPNWARWFKARFVFEHGT